MYFLRIENNKQKYYNMDCDLIKTLPGIVVGIMLVISEILPFIPDKYIQSNGILHLIVNIIKQILEQNHITVPPLVNPEESSKLLNNESTSSTTNSNP